MTEAFIFIALLAFIAWQVLDYAPVMVTPEGFTFKPDPVSEKEKEFNRIANFKKDTNIPAPDPAIGEAAAASAELGREWLAMSKEQFGISQERQAELDKLTKRVTEKQLATQEQADLWATEDRARYEEKFQPIEDKYVEEALAFGGEAGQEAAAAEARADVMKSADIQKGITSRDMARMGIDPRSGRSEGIRSSADTGTALAAAGAENVARGRTRTQGRAMRGDVINMGRGLPSQAMAAAGLGLSAGGQAVNTNLAGQGNFRANTGIMSQGYQGALGGIGQSANIYNQQYGNQVQAWGMQQQADASLWGGIGQAAGMFAMASSKDVKTNKKEIDGALDAVNNMPIESWDYKPGEGDGDSHIGGYAEDFKKNTGMGDGKSINVIDALGLTMKSIQELDEKVEHISSSKNKSGHKKSTKRKPVTIEGEYSRVEGMGI